MFLINFFFFYYDQIIITCFHDEMLYVESVTQNLKRLLCGCKQKDEMCLSDKCFCVFQLSSCWSFSLGSSRLPDLQLLRSHHGEPAPPPSVIRFLTVCTTWLNFITTFRHIHLCFTCPHLVFSQSLHFLSIIQHATRWRMIELVFSLWLDSSQSN